jgi:RimJ/RimL family protein N-acetyltransferase
MDSMPSVTLREVAEDDLPAFFEHQRDTEANRMAGFPSRDHDAFMEHWTKVLGDPSVTARTVVVDGQVAGNIVSFLHDGRREIGYWIGRAFWGKGIATEALTAFLDLEPTRPLYAGVAGHNIASIRVLEKCGFVVTSANGDDDAAGAPSEVLLVLEPRTDP